MTTEFDAVRGTVLVAITDEVAWEHVAEIIFESHDGGSLNCLLCKAGDRAGAWEHFTGMTLAEGIAHLEEAEYDE